jgi:DNA-binding transcriptional MerR regulator
MQTNARARSRDASSPLSSSSASADALLWASLGGLQLNIAQTASLCGISVRQLGYWTKQGYVAAEGRGERRMYGLDSLRRILSIRRLMAEGHSLRQALRAMPATGSPPAPGEDAGPGVPALSYSPPIPASDDLMPENAGALARQVLRLFDGNRHVRDSADGLALKLGWPSALVRRVAEALCAQGVLSKTLVQSEPVFQRLEGAAR